MIALLLYLGLPVYRSLPAGGCPICSTTWIALVTLGIYIPALHSAADTLNTYLIWVHLIQQGRCVVGVVGRRCVVGVVGRCVVGVVGRRRILLVIF